MKTMVLIIAIAAVVSAGCSNPLNSNESLQDFIPGIYARVFRQQNAYGRDTLLITAIGSNSEVYSIIKKTSFRRIINGRTLSSESHLDKWIGIYDNNSKLIREQKTGKIFVFDAAGGRLFVGTTEYKKIQP